MWPFGKDFGMESEDLGSNSYFTMKQFVIMSEIYVKIPHQLWVTLYASNLGQAITQMWIKDEHPRAGLRAF